MGELCVPARGIGAFLLKISLPIGIVYEVATFIQAPALTLMTESLSTLTARTRNDCGLVKFLCGSAGHLDRCRFDLGALVKVHSQHP